MYSIYEGGFYEDYYSEAVMCGTMSDMKRVTRKYVLEYVPVRTGTESTAYSYVTVWGEYLYTAVSLTVLERVRYAAVADSSR